MLSVAVVEHCKMNEESLAMWSHSIRTDTPAKPDPTVSGNAQKKKKEKNKLKNTVSVRYKFYKVR